MSPLSIKRLTWTHPDAIALRSAQQLEIDSLRPIGPGISATATNVPIFLIAYDEAEPVGCGVIRPLAEQG
jgi:putative acetyltransferase